MKLCRVYIRSRALIAHLIVLAMMAVPIFGHLGDTPVIEGDELRLAVNALETVRSGNLFAITFGGKPELWNTKPPLLLWAQAASMRAFGYSELSYRLPSAICSGLLCFLLLRFLKRRTGHWLPGIIAAIILITTPGFVGMHGSRTGDYDAPLTFLLTASLFYLADWAEDGKARWLYYSGFALIAAVLTKGIAGLFFCPAMIVYVLAQQKGKSMLRSHAFYVCIACFVVLVGGYYLLRESLQPGYLLAVAKNELVGRYTATLEGHKGDTWYYIVVLQERFTQWTWAVIPAFLAAFAVRDKLQRRIALLCLLTAASLFLFLTAARTKISWYLMPAYPLLAVACALFLWQVCRLLLQYKPAGATWKLNFLPLVLLLLICTTPYMLAYDQAMIPQPDPFARDAKLYLHEVLNGDRELAANAVSTNEGYQLTWYREVLEIKGLRLPLVQRDSLHPKMKVMTWNEEEKNYISRHYTITQTESHGDIQIFSVGSEHYEPDTSAAKRVVP